MYQRWSCLIAENNGLRDGGKQRFWEEGQSFGLIEMPTF